MFDNIYGQESVKNRLSNLISSKKISNAYIFTGIEGVGKFKTAKEFARLLINVGDAENSPDFIVVEAKKGDNMIKVDQIREINRTINIKPNSDYKVYVINDAEKMNIQAQNALLKTLEEPSSYGIIILVTRNEQILLDTIRSRCIEVRFSPLDREKIESILVKNGESRKNAQMVSSFCRGSVKNALDIIKDGKITEQREMVQNFLNDIFADKNRFRISSASDAFSKYESDIYMILELLQMYIRDAIIFRDNVYTDLLINRDRLDFIRKIAMSASIAQFGKSLDIIEDAKSKLKSNCSFSNTVQTMALNIFEVVSEW